jgi:hypothetical protein
VKYHTRIGVPVLLPAKEVHDVLSKLCSKYGFCLPGDEIEKLAANPPTEIEEFTKAVLIAEGYGYTRSDPLCVKARAVVAEAFVAHQESRGAQI